MCWLIQRCTSACMIDYPPQDVFRVTWSFYILGNMTIFRKRCKIETWLQWGLIGNRMLPIDWHHCHWSWMTLKVTFAVWKSCHITPILRCLYWLRITERIEYKLLSLTYKVLTTTQPPYLHKLISTQRPRSRLLALHPSLLLLGQLHRHL